MLTGLILISYSYSFGHGNKASVKEGQRECKEQRQSTKKGTEKEKKKEAH